jgi:hypothetical protein
MAQATFAQTAYVLASQPGAYASVRPA